MRNSSTTRIPRKAGIVAGFLALAAIPALGLGAYAAADTASGETTPDATRPDRPRLSDTQKQCLADHGVTLPERSATGERPAPPTDAERAAFRAAAEACGITLPAHRPGFALSDTQKQCLADHGVTLPERSATGERPPPLTDEQRAAMKAAAEACGITFPARAPRFQLSDTQKQCLADHGVTLPERSATGERPAPPTDEQRAAFRAAAEACDIAFPARGGPSPGGTSI